MSVIVTVTLLNVHDFFLYVPHLGFFFFFILLSYFNYILSMSKSLLLCIIILIIIWLPIVIINIEEIGTIYVALFLLIIFQLLCFALIITFC